MKKQHVTQLSIVFTALVFFLGCEDSVDPGENGLGAVTRRVYVTDIDGNRYITSKIGDKKWMSENLRVTRYRNGDPITTNLNDDWWRRADYGAYHHVTGPDGEISTEYGKLYNWYAVDDPRGLCPEGWHVPSDKEWTTLIDKLGGKKFGGKLKSTRTSPDSHPRWNAPNTGADDKYGFAALPAGSRILFGDGFELPDISNEKAGRSAYFWSSTYLKSSAHTRYLSYNSGSLTRSYHLIGSGLSVRCVKKAK